MGGPTLGIFGMTPQVILPGGDVIDRVLAQRLSGDCSFFSRIQYASFQSPNTTGAQKNLSVDSDKVRAGSFWWVLAASSTMFLVAAYDMGIYLMPPNVPPVPSGASYGNAPSDFGILVPGHTLERIASGLSRASVGRPFIVPPGWSLRAQTDMSAAMGNISIGDAIRFRLAFIEFSLSEPNPCL